MSGKVLSGFLSLCVALLMTLCESCHQANDDRLPSMPVNIQIDTAGLWNTYGVFGYGMYRYFILYQGLVVPSDFTYKYGSATGYGGVLLIYGQNPFTGDVGPLAYDLSCPVERRPDIRIEMEDETLEAVCPDCGSRYNVVDAGGIAIDGPALKFNYAMTRYQCLATSSGGYVITE